MWQCVEPGEHPRAEGAGNDDGADEGDGGGGKGEAPNMQGGLLERTCSARRLVFPRNIHQHGGSQSPTRDREQQQAYRQEMCWLFKARRWKCDAAEAA